jgi:hypothetical protein
MFGLFTRSRRPSARLPHPRVRLSLERLEARDCPYINFQITSFTATILPAHTIQLSGTVQDSDPASVQLTFSGAATGTTAALANGTFSFSTTTGSLGTAYAVGVDGQNVTSNTAAATVAVAAPTLTLNVAYGDERHVSLTGTVTDIDPGGRPVSFAGKVTGSATTNSNGSYSYATTATGLGTVTATVTDLWGQTGTATVTLAMAPPTVYGFTAQRGLGSMWTFSGDVADPQLAYGMPVSFSGLPEFNSSTNTTVAADDTFTEAVALASGHNAVVTVTVTDWWGQTGTATTTVQT